MAMSRASYATGNAERLAQRARSFIRNEIKATGKRVITQEQFEELRGFLAAIADDWRVPRSRREQLRQSIWAEFDLERPGAVLISTREAADRKKRLGL